MFPEGPRELSSSFLIAESQLALSHQKTLSAGGLSWGGVRILEVADGAERL